MIIGAHFLLYSTDPEADQAGDVDALPPPRARRRCIWRAASRAEIAVLRSDHRSLNQPHLRHSSSDPAREWPKNLAAADPSVLSAAGEPIPYSLSKIG
jgi:hypothetical protein